MTDGSAPRRSTMDVCAFPPALGAGSIPSTPMDFLVARDDLHRVRFEDAGVPEPAEGQALLAVDAFGLSANNITYATFGEAMSYWSFFPAEEGWGRVPVWGFAEVSESRHEGLPAGTRVYGYLPPSSHVVLTPERVRPEGFFDASPHRAELPSAYNSYVRVEGDPAFAGGHEDEQMLLRPLFMTSYLLADFLADSGLLAGAVVISSASSKTASALGFLLSRAAAGGGGREQQSGGDAKGDGEVVGLTSARAERFTRELGVYDRLLTYEQLDSLPDGSASYVDIAGNPSVRDAVHRHYGDRLSHSAVVGATHHDTLATAPAGGSLPGPQPTLFFAPDHMAKRTQEWGREELERRIAQAWGTYVEWTSQWLQVQHGRGRDAVREAYLQLLDGRIDPARAHVLSL
jgi:hypothetical protein